MRFQSFVTNVKRHVAVRIGRRTQPIDTSLLNKGLLGIETEEPAAYLNPLP